LLIRTNRAKSDEFALIGVYTLFHVYFFCVLVVFGCVDLKFYLKKVGTKIKLHARFISI